MNTEQLVKFKRIFEERLAEGTGLDWPEYDNEENEFIVPDEPVYDFEMYEYMQLVLMGYQWGLDNASV